MGIATEKDSGTFTENNLIEVEMALEKKRNHPSINAITERMENLGDFTFNFVSYDDTVKEGFTKDRYFYKNCQGKCGYHIAFPIS